MTNAVLRLPEVKRRTGLSRSSIYNRIAMNEFPKGFSLGGRARGWLESDIEQWIADCAAARLENRTITAANA
jgi:prophage regulatory protein